MVDRITPAPNAKTLADAVALAGCEDQGAVETEPFSQWVIEDRFPMGRPAFEAGGALFVDDVAPYERMKLRMLNGAHSMLAYAGFLAGHAYVRDVIADEALGFLVERHMRAASATLRPLSGISFNDYAAALLARFRNPAIAHETWQIAMDGTEKLPQRLFEPAQHALDHGQDIRPFAFAVAAWMRYCLGRTDDGQIYALRDPRETEIAACLADSDDNAAALSDALHALPGLFPKSLIEAPSWRATVEKILTTMLRQGVAAAIRSEAATRRQPHPSAS
jgi:fructuronate reductase